MRNLLLPVAAIGYVAALGLAALVPLQSRADEQYTHGPWMLTVHSDTHCVDITNQSRNRFNGVYATSTYNLVGESAERTIDSKSAAAPEISQTAITDEFGSGTRYSLAFTDGTAQLTQNFCFYDSVPYLLVSCTLRGLDGAQVESRKMIPLVTTNSSYPLSATTPRKLYVPFDNDTFDMGYESLTFGTKTDGMVSSEVTCLYDAASRQGVVIGSVDHDCWKSSVSMRTQAGGRLAAFECRSGYTDPTITHEKAEHHGKLQGTEIASARYLVGVFDDWRDGMETFGEACCRVMPRWEWEGGNPVGWNSWGNMMFNVSQAGIVGNAQYLHDTLQPLGFYGTDGKVLISLDSGGEDASNAYDLGNKIFGSGKYRDGRETKQGLDMNFGAYGGLAVWEWLLDSKIPGTGLNGTSDYKWRDICLKVDGEIYTPNPGVKDYAMDCTHPAVRAMLEYQFKKWASYNVKYVKFDFLNCAIVDGDKYYDPAVRTGVQNYNYGMGIVRELCERYGIYLAESIAPIFPYAYGCGRRVCCDRWSRLDESEFVMNALSYGWWTDRLYSVNDPDQLVLFRQGSGAAESAGENRVRFTSGMVGGAFILADNFSDAMKITQNPDNDYHRAVGDSVGYPQHSRQRVEELMGTAGGDILEYVRTHRGSFRPVEGDQPSSGRHSESFFVRDTPQYLYLAVFNWSKYIAKKGTMDFERLGIAPQNVGEIKELWTAQQWTSSGATKLSYDVPAGDVRIYRLAKRDFSGISSPTDVNTDSGLRVNLDGDRLTVYSDGATTEPVSVYNLLGRQVAAGYTNQPITIAGSGVLLVKAGSKATKIIRNS